MVFTQKIRLQTLPYRTALDGQCDTKPRAFFLETRLGKISIAFCYGFACHVFFLFCDCLQFCWSIFGLSAVGRQPSRQAMLMSFAVIWDVKSPALALYHRDKLRKDRLHNITPHHPASHHTMSRRTTPHHTTPSHITPRHITQPRITPHHPHITPHHHFYT